MSTVRHLTSVDDLSPAETLGLLKLAQRLKREWNAGVRTRPLDSQTLAMIFEKPSLRSRVTFEIGMTQLGGNAVYLAPGDIQIGKRESPADVAKNLSRWVQGIMARTFSHDTVLELAANATIPVINALSDYEHPCQALAFGQLVLERRGALAGAKVTFVGDGNNVVHSLLLLAAKTGMSFTISCPEGYEPNEKVVRRCFALGGTCRVLRDPEVAVADADFIYTDVWASMGQEAEAEKRKRDFRGYQVNDELLARAPAHALVTHCLPAHRGEEITDGVMDGPQCAAFEEAENRLHVQKAVLLHLMKHEPLP